MRNSLKDITKLQLRLKMTLLPFPSYFSELLKQAQKKTFPGTLL